MARRTAKQESKIKTMDGTDVSASAPVTAVATRNYLDVRELWEKTGKPNVLMVMTGRGTGKSTSVQKWVIDHCKGTGRKFILISRDAFIQQKRQAWFHGAMMKGLISDKVECYQNKFMIENEVIGFNWSLHAYADYRSTEYPEVDFIIFEEFIEMEMSSYWSENGLSEAQFLADLTSTVFRDRSDGAVIMLGNNHNENSKYNPYFDAWGIDFDEIGIKMGDTYTVTDTENMKAVLYYGGMGRDNGYEGVKGWSAYMPLNDVALTGEFRPLEYVLNNFLKDNGITLKQFDNMGVGYAYCTGGVVEYMTKFRYNDHDFLIVGRTAYPATEYRPIIVNSVKRQNKLIDRLAGNVLYEMSKDYAIMRKATEKTVFVTETVINSPNYKRLSETVDGVDLCDRIMTEDDYERWVISNIIYYHDHDEYIDNVRKLKPVPDRWIEFYFNRYKDMLN